MVERWKDIPGFGGKYQVSTEGNFRRILRSGKIRNIRAFRKKTSKNGKLVVKLTRDGEKGREEVAAQMVAITFLGPIPENAVVYHKNQLQTDINVNNLAYITKKELGKMTGASSNRKAVVKLDASGQIVDVYSSAREAGRKNFLSRQTVTDRCNGKVKKGPAPDGYEYAWEDSAVSMRKAVRRMELSGAYVRPMSQAPDVEFDF